MEEEQQDITHALQIGGWRAALMFTVEGAFSILHSTWLCCWRSSATGLPTRAEGDVTACYSTWICDQSAVSLDSRRGATDV